MKKILALSLFTSALLFHGCGGGGGGGTSSSPSSTSMVTKVLVDSQISGVSYSCGNTNSITSKQGEFTCPLNETVEFKIGGITLGRLSITSSSPSIITPSILVGTSSSDTSSENVIKFLRFVQSLDKNNNPSDGIEIEESVRNNLKNEKRPLSDIDSSDLSSLITKADSSKTLIEEKDAKKHYEDTLNNLNKPEPLFDSQWALAKNDTYYSLYSINNNAHIHAVSDSYNALNIYKGRGVKIAVIDDGIDENHEDLKDSIVKKYSTENNDEKVAHYSFEGHGTRVTGIIAARKNNLGILGLAPESQIMIIKLQSGNISDSEYFEAFQKAQEWGADIINCSWGTRNVSSLVKAKIEDLADNGRAGKGTVIVFASGNFNRDMGNDESNIEKVLSVGASGSKNDRTSYSNFGKNLDILAPGGDAFAGITTLYPYDSSNPSFKYILPSSVNYKFVGTSASAPIMSGVVALMLEKNPNLTRAQIENYIKDNADKIGSASYTDISGSGKNNWNSHYGHGKVNVKKILDAIPSS